MHPLWVVFKVQNRHFRYLIDAEGDGETLTIELLNGQGDAIASYAATNFFGECQPGGYHGDIYDLDNGDRICLYWD